MPVFLVSEGYPTNPYLWIDHEQFVIFGNGLGLHKVAEKIKNFQPKQVVIVFPKPSTSKSFTQQVSAIAKFRFFFHGAKISFVTPCPQLFGQLQMDTDIVSTQVIGENYDLVATEEEIVLTDKASGIRLFSIGKHMLSRMTSQNLKS